MDPQHTLFLEHAWDALESSGYLGDATTTRVGVFAGISISTYLIYNLLSHPDMLETAGGLLVKHTNDKDYVATRVSYKLNLRGPSMTVQTGCSTSLVATHLACQSLLEGECDIAIAGGATINVPQCRGYLYQEGGIASPDGKCRPFDAKASGTVLTGGVGVVVLKRLSAAIVDGDHIHAVIRGTAVNNDGSAKVGFTAPGVEGQAAVIREAMAIAGVEARDISYITPTAPGRISGTRSRSLRSRRRSDLNPRRPLCDRISEGQHRTREYGRGCGRAHDDRARPRTSASTADGEFREPKPRHPFADSPFYIPQTLEPWQSDGGPRIAGVSSFGMGGTNAHAVLEEPPPVRPAIPYRTTASCLFRPEQRALSKRRQRASPTGSRVTPRRHSPTSPSRFRSAGVASLIAGSWSVVPSRRASPHSASPWRSQSSLASTKPASAPLPSCSRQGAQYVGMARGLYEREPEFRDCLDRCASVLQDKLGGDIRALLPGVRGHTRVGGTRACPNSVDAALPLRN